MKQNFSAVVEQCLQRLDRGENLPDVLADYPAYADQLESLLLVAMASRALPVPIPSQTAQRLGRNQMLAEMAKLEVEGAWRKIPAAPLTNRWISSLAGILRRIGYNKVAYSSRLAMVSLVLILSGAFLTLNASASSQPGDLFYTLKSSLERSGLVWVIGSEEPQEDSSFPGQSDLHSEQSSEVLLGVNSKLIGSDKNTPSPAFSDANLEGANPTQGNADETELTEAEREGEKVKAAEVKETEKDLKEAEKAAAAEERDDEKDLKEAEKAAAAEERKAEKDLKETEKEASQQLKDAGKQTDQPALDKNSRNQKPNKSAGNDKKKAK